MDYAKLAEEFALQLLRHKSKQPKGIEDGIHGEMFVLYCINERGEIVPGDISNMMGVTSARVAAALGSLESKGLITREIDKIDRRRIIVKATEQGTKVLEEQKKKHLSEIERILETLGEKDAKDYIRITGRIAEIMSEK